MKVKFEFEKSDFDGGGQMVIREDALDGSGDISDLSFAATVCFKIGYIPATKECCRISLTDGAVIAYDSKEELVHALAGYRPMTEQQIMHVTQYIGNRLNIPGAFINLRAMRKDVD